MNFPSIDIQGSIISSDLLGKIRSEQATFQQGKDFNKDFTNAKLKDEISSAWQDAKGQWTIFQNKLSRLNQGETGTTETRNFWIVPLLANLGYNLSFNRQSEELNGKLFPIGYRDSQLDGFPVYIAGFNESLDRRPENKQLRVSPHAMVQEYLNYSEHLYGLVTNGKQLRLLRDASRITRLSYVEFNLQKMMEEDLYSDFVLLYRLLHESRMPRKIDGGAESIIEKFHQEGLEAGSTIRSKLGEAVKDTIKALANGFINHPDNAHLRIAMQNGELNADEYYHHQLRIVYRLLFLFVIEERNLVYADSRTTETKRYNQIYFNYYSLLRLRKLAKKLPPPEAHRYYDLWQSLLDTFALFEKKEMGEKLGIMSLQGDLFSYDAIGNHVYDLHHCRLSNAVLLGILKALGYFENENGVMIAVNYGGLDVEEFGSVYEGLLELKLKIEPVAGSETYNCTFDTSNERSKSGSHYTPEELVQPLIKHSLEYLIEDRIKPYQQKKTTKENTVESLLNLKICDVACGSGHILLSAARRVALEIARVQTEEEQPNPLAVRKAMKDVIRHCIYGVDKNPLAVELCKVALWLESHNPGEPLSFLDHHIKCGDAIVGLAHREELENGIADEAFKALSPEEKQFLVPARNEKTADVNYAAYLAKQNKIERISRGVNIVQLKADFEKNTASSVNESMSDYKSFNSLPENTPEEIEIKAKNYKKFIEGKGFTFLKAMADTQIAQFFIPKVPENKDLLMTDGDFRQILSGYKGWQDRKVAKAIAIASENRFFHWFLEFPEVFASSDIASEEKQSKGGFDCILGNPPFLGGQKLTGNFGDNYLECIKYEFSPIGAVDLVTYFFRRIFNVIKYQGFQSLISTNTIAQGKVREYGLDVITKNGGTINHAIKSIRWPGVAAVDVSLVTIIKQIWKGKFILAGKEVKTITPYLDDAETLGNPFPLKQNEGKSYQGSIVLGKGFVLETNAADSLIKKDQKNKDILFPYLSGEDLNNNPDQSPSRWVINFFDWEETKAIQYKDCYEIIERLVKPERQRWAKDKKGNDIIGEFALRKPLPDKWWIYGEKRPALYRAIANKERVIVNSIVSKYCLFVYEPTNIVFSHRTAVFPIENFKTPFLFSSLHNEWTWKITSTLGGTTINYSTSDVLLTFPFPYNLTKKHEPHFENIGEQYHEYRKQLMLQMQLGLTKTYNAFHAKEVQQGIITAAMQAMDKKAIEKQYGKEVWNLWNHLQKTEGTCNIEEAFEGIVKLRELHVQMDNAVLEAYGWQDVQLKHDFYEVDYLPENDRVRYTIHPDARKEILKRLLELNHKIHEEEVAAGLWEKKKTVAKKTKPNEVNEPAPGYGDLFE